MPNNMRAAIREINNFLQAPGASHGPYTLHWIGGVMFRLLHHDASCGAEDCDGQHGDFLRYCDEDDVAQLHKLVREGDSDEFVSMAHLLEPTADKQVPCFKSDREVLAHHGEFEAECEWIETHDDTTVRYAGKNIIWPDGCWVVQKRGFERQLVDPAGLKYIASEVLGMAAQDGELSVFDDPGEPVSVRESKWLRDNELGLSSLFDTSPGNDPELDVFDGPAAEPVSKTKQYAIDKRERSRQSAAKAKERAARDAYFESLGYEPVDFGGGWGFWDANQNTMVALTPDEVEETWQMKLLQTLEGPDYFGSTAEAVDAFEELSVFDA